MMLLNIKFQNGALKNEMQAMPHHNATNVGQFQKRVRVCIWIFQVKCKEEREGAVHKAKGKNSSSCAHWLTTKVCRCCASATGI